MEPLKPLNHFEVTTFLFIFQIIQSILTKFLLYWFRDYYISAPLVLVTPFTEFTGLYTSLSLLALLKLVEI